MCSGRCGRAWPTLDSGCSRLGPALPVLPPQIVTMRWAGLALPIVRTSEVGRCWPCTRTHWRCGRPHIPIIQEGLTREEDYEVRPVAAMLGVLSAQGQGGRRWRLSRDSSSARPGPPPLLCPTAGAGRLPGHPVLQHPPGPGGARGVRRAGEPGRTGEGPGGSWEGLPCPLAEGALGA